LQVISKNSDTFADVMIHNKVQQTQHKVLIVDDEPDILEILRFNLEMEGYEVFTAESPFEAEEIVENQQVDLIMLDVMMTPKSGFEWARELKADPQTEHLPIIFCTAKTMEKDLLHGFALGSDDYICKPFRVSEVKARVAAVLRRTSSDNQKAKNETSEAPSNSIIYEGIKMNLDTKEVCIDGQIVPFTKLEFELLALLLKKPGQLYSREEILRKVWPNDTIVLDRTVDVNITRIRKKIGKYEQCIRTKFGYGYMFKG